MAKLKIKKEILWTLLVVVLIAAIIIPIVIVYTAAEQDNGNRIACFPLMEKGNDTNLESVCNEKGCIYDAAATNVKCYLPLTGTYGYEVILFEKSNLNANQNLANFKFVCFYLSFKHYNSTINSGDGTYIQHQLRRRQGNPSLHGGDIEDVQFKLVYYGEKMLRFTVSTYQSFLTNGNFSFNYALCFTVFRKRKISRKQSTSSGIKLTNC